MSDYLAHHGIKGMKWGIRRFQNEDGTRTPEGLKRYSKATRRNIKRAMNRNHELERSDWKGANKHRHEYLDKQNEAIRPYRDALDKARDDERKISEDFYKKWSDPMARGQYYEIYTHPKWKEDIVKEHPIDEDAYKNYVKDLEERDTKSRLLTRGPYLAWREAFDDYGKQHADEWLSATLQDIGIEDTQKGRDLLKKMYPNITK